MLETIWAKVDTTKIPSHHNEHIVDFENLQKMRKTAPRCCLSVVVIVLVKDVSDAASPRINDRVCGSCYSSVRHQMREDQRDLGTS